MRLTLNKIEDENKLQVEQSLYTKKYVLTIDRKHCVGCDICMLICHTEAISLKPRSKKGGKAIASLVDVDPQKCDYCSMCQTICPFGAITVTLNGKKFVPVVEKGSFPELIRDINVDSERCEPNCKICEEKCPLKIVEVHFESRNKKCEKSATNSSKKTIVNINEKLCPCCKQCEFACPPKVVRIRKIFNGTITINHEKCPEKCSDCVDVCPVEALYLDNERRVNVKEQFCVYCKACVNVCPVEKALEVERISVHHTSIQSGAWNKALEKITSRTGVDRELNTKRLKKVWEMTKKLKI